MKNKKKTKRWPAVVISIILLIAVPACLYILLIRRSPAAKPVPLPKDAGAIFFTEPDSEHIVETDAGIAFADNEILIGCAPEVTQEEIEAIAQEHSLEIVGCIAFTGEYQLRCAEALSDGETESLLETLITLPGIEYAQRNYCIPVETQEVREDIRPGSEWENSPGELTEAGWGAAAIRAPETWELLNANKSHVNPVAVGLIDSGFDASHNDLPFTDVFYNEGWQNEYDEAERLFVANPGDPDLNEKISRLMHGSHVAGTMAADGTNAAGICGIYPYAHTGGLYGCRYSHQNDHPENFVSEIAYRVCLAELLLRNVKVINISMGGNLALYFDYYSTPGHEDQTKLQTIVTINRAESVTMCRFLKRFLNNGYDFIIVNSAGNHSNGLFELDIGGHKISHQTGPIPATLNTSFSGITEDDDADVYHRIIVVGSMDKQYNVSYFSDRGSRVDIYAPGEDIYSTVPANHYAYKGWQGTSMAAPHVAGAAATIWSVAPWLTGDQVKGMIVDTKNVNHPGIDLLDMYTPVRALLNYDAEGTELEEGFGMLSGFVVRNLPDYPFDDQHDMNDYGVKNAVVTVFDAVTGERVGEPVTTDGSGHFDFILAPGDYRLTASANGADDYTWPETITIEEKQVRYLDEWIKLTLDEQTDVGDTESERQDTERNDNSGNSLTGWFDALRSKASDWADEKAQSIRNSLMEKLNGFEQKIKEAPEKLIEKANNALLDWFMQLFYKVANAFYRFLTGENLPVQAPGG